VAWLSRLSFAQALRWALLWPGAILAAAATTWLAAWVRGSVVSVAVEPVGGPPALAGPDTRCVGRTPRPARCLSRRVETRAALSSTWPLPNVRWSCRAICGSGYAAMAILRSQLTFRRYTATLNFWRYTATEPLEE
jgi:hypothetical protein